MKKGAQYKFKLKGEKIATPRGIGQFIWVNKPNTRFAEEGEAGNYEATILLSPADAQPIIDKLSKLKAAALAEVKAEKGKAKEADDPFQTDEKTGLIKLKFKKPAESTVDGKRVKNHVAVVDAKANLIPQDKMPAIGSGSTIRINGFAKPFFVPSVGVGVSLQLRGLQLLKLVSFGGGDDTDFEKDDDGFEFTPDEGAGSTESASEGGAEGPADEAAGEDTPDF